MRSAVSGIENDREQTEVRTEFHFALRPIRDIEEETVPIHRFYEWVLDVGRSKIAERPAYGVATAGIFSPFQGSEQVSERQEISNGEDRCAGGGHDVIGLEFRSIGVISPGHAEIAEEELGRT